MIDATVSRRQRPHAEYRRKHPLPPPPPPHREGSAILQTLPWNGPRRRDKNYHVYRYAWPRTATRASQTARTKAVAPPPIVKRSRVPVPAVFVQVPVHVAELASHAHKFEFHRLVAMPDAMGGLRWRGTNSANLQN
jgi:hypothetical protein